MYRHKTTGGSCPINLHIFVVPKEKKMFNKTFTILSKVYLGETDLYIKNNLYHTSIYVPLQLINNQRQRWK